ncbi:hypothetical protein PVAND_002080 [Polypedilum vanderplanki]|uniref:Uncharacterized protein n=1 Tax=Polypedilum vanderplanki TaxID=319348 RepID=A0A9J6BQ80_POLVA|nr:hypothetical protein PVAND_002080 [Polypedilum vanderplanki]
MRIHVIIFIFIYILPTLHSVSHKNASDNEVMLRREKRKALFFPQYTILQLSMCLIAQVSAITSHRVAVNHGFQINYNLPFNVSSFYSPMFWARKISKSSNMFIDFFERMTESDDIAGNEDETVESATLIEEDETTTETLLERNQRMIYKDDFYTDLSAGQFYASIIETMEYAGYHEDCLLKSVCELAKIPIYHEDNKQIEEDIMSEVLHFVLTPSLHQAFDSEREMGDKELYEEAEKIGKEDGDCELIYTECKMSPLHAISNFISIESHQ